MINNTVLDYIEKTLNDYSNNIAIGDVEKQLTFSQLITESKKAGTSISTYNKARKPIAILMDRSASTTIAMLGVMYSGNFYVVLDSESPFDRLEKIVTTLEPFAVVYEKRLKEVVDKFDDSIVKLEFETIVTTQVDVEILENRRKNMTSSDPIYSIFTSGSTGFPKGAILTHQNVISYIQWFTECFNINSETVFGSQTPFYFSMSVSDFFATLFTGASYQIIPKQFFAFPAKLVPFLNERKVNTIYWVPSAMFMFAKLDIFKYCKLNSLKTVLFAGEVMPIKCLNYWKKNLPDITYSNLFGPTETTDICSYYVVDRDFEDHQTLPIGRACENCRLFIVDEDGNEVIDDKTGELYVAGPFVASGYYNNKEKTQEVFIQNPINKSYPEIVYKTGDLVKRNIKGELEYLGRKDFQIKHMGYRIELGEIEAVISSIKGVEQAICIYDVDSDSIAFYYEGDKTLESTLVEELRSKLPVYMQPQKCIFMNSLPKNANGKIDRLKLKMI